MKNKSVGVAKTNFRNMHVAFITIACIYVILIQDIVYFILSLFDIYPGKDSSTLATGNYLYIFVLIGAILIPALNFRKMMNLGAKRNAFLKGCGINYIIIAAAVSLINLLLYYTYEPFRLLFYSGELPPLDVLYWFGWINNGVIAAFFQQFAFLLLAAATAHTLTAIQGKWYGWITDVIIIAIISVFTPIAPLRAALVWFFNLIIFYQNAFIQIAACLVLAAAIYSLNKFVFARKPI